MRNKRQASSTSLIPLIICILGIGLIVGVSLFSIFYLGIFKQPDGSENSKGTVGPSNVHVPRYEKFELTFPFSGSYSNPNDPTVVDVEATFAAPNGNKQTIPGFFFQDFTRSGDVNKETLTPVPGSDRWKIRYAPSEIGTYTYMVTIKDSQGTRVLGSGSFDVTPSLNPGFVRAAGFHFVRDNGQQFIPLGINAPWFQRQQPHKNGHSWGDGTYGVDAMYKQFVANGANFFHLWTCSWAKGARAPFAKPNIGCDGGDVGIEQMSQPDSWEIDYMVDQAHAKDIYIMPILKHRDQQVFENADKIKSRYFLARWGYSTNVIAWDFCKEGGTNPATNHAWASYMDSIDPYKHMRTTSQWNHFATGSANQLQKYDQIFSDPLMTLVQNHDYTADCPGDFHTDPGFALFYMKLDPSGTDPRNFRKFNKPSFFGETGVNPASGSSCMGDGSSRISQLYDIDHTGLILKSQIWGMLMGTSGGYAPWNYQFDLNGSWTQFVAFKGARAYVNALPPIPDSAALFTTYEDDNQAITSDTRLSVIGRKNSNFAMLFVQNTTGTAFDILHGKTATAVSGTITLKDMQARATFTVHWYNTDNGALVKTEHITANAASLRLTLPEQITQNIAVIITTGAP